MRQFISSIVLIMIMGSWQVTSINAQSEENWLGTNLSAVFDWTSQHPFVDIFKTSRPWISQREGAGWGEGGDLALTADGWIAELASGQWADTILFTDDTMHPTGVYTLLYDGEGRLEFWGAPITIVSEAPNRILVDVPADIDLFISIRETNVANPLRNIRFIMPGHEETYTTQPFNPDFLARLQGFGVLRFMDWMRTNDGNIGQGAWENRPQVGDATYVWRGVPVEIMVQLANVVGADAWFNMPHLADDTYVRDFASIVQEQLNPQQKIYIEYSNETWNSIFPSSRYVIEQGLALGLSDNDFQAGLYYHSQRAIEIFTIWENVFNGTERLVRVLASQSGNAWTAEQVATWQNAYERADAIAIAPYFSCDDPASPENALITRTMSVDALLDQQLASINGCALEQIRDNQAVASEYGLQLIAYEGGQHLVGYFGTENDEALTALFIEANRHPRMYDLYRQYLAHWQSITDGVFVNFSDVEMPSKWGSWGVLEYVSQPIEEAPKYRALRDVMAQLP